MIFPFSNNPFNNNNAIHENKIIYFCLRPDFRKRITLNAKNVFSMICRFGTHNIMKIYVQNHIM